MYARELYRVLLSFSSKKQLDLESFWRKEVEELSDGLDMKVAVNA